MGKRKKKSKSIWSKLTSNPEGLMAMLQGFGDIYAGSKGMSKDRKTGEYFKPDPTGKPRTLQ